MIERRPVIAVCLLGGRYDVVKLPIQQFFGWISIGLISQSVLDDAALFICQIDFHFARSSGNKISHQRNADGSLFFLLIPFYHGKPLINGNRF